jgi:hypothetical protein
MRVQTHSASGFVLIGESLEKREYACDFCSRVDPE